MKQLIIMRGLPGSGKSYTAQSLAQDAILTDGHNVLVASTDEWFIGEDGVYRFDAKDIARAHRWNQARVEARMKSCGSHSVIIVDNTNTQLWEMRPYVEMARRHDYIVTIERSEAPWRDDVNACHEKCTHGVPLEAMERMASRWEEGTIDEILSAKAPWES